MAVIKFSVYFLALSFLWTSSRADVCNVKERCILPCTFEVGDEVVIHWILVKLGNIQVHSYYHNKDQFGLQDQRFSGRTSLFTDQIVKGNASLQLTEVKLQDEGRYKCYTSTIRKNKESFVTLKVEAPVHKVNIQMAGNNLTCSSEGIYPQPELTWSTRPPSNISPQNTTTVQQNEEKLYSISSSLILSDSNTNLVYSCTVSTPTNRKRATLSKTTFSSGSSSETKLTCGTSKTPQMDLVWTFNHSQTIVDWKRTSSSFTVSEEWRQQVKDVSESGEITLKDLSSHQEGIYTCELSDAEETLITETSLKISGETSSNVVPIAVGMTVVVGVIVAAVLIFLFYRKRRKQHKPVARDDGDGRWRMQIVESQSDFTSCTKSEEDNNRTGDR